MTQRIQRLPSGGPPLASAHSAAASCPAAPPPEAAPTTPACPASARSRGIVPSARTARLLIAILLTGLSLPPMARAVCTPDPPSMDGQTVTCTDEVSTGYDVSAFDDLDITITGNSVFDDTGAGLDSAIRIGDETELLFDEDSLLNVTGANASGIRGDNDNFVENQGTIDIDGAGARGIRIGDNTTGILPNGAVNGANGQILANGDDSVAIESGANAGVATSGLIDLNGARTIGLSAGNRIDFSARANITNDGTIEIDGADSFGIKAGDGWIDDLFVPNPFLPPGAGIRNLGAGTINVSGDRSIGIYAGDEANARGNHNSFVVNGDGATIDVSGVDSIGVSIGGNDVLIPNDARYQNLVSFENLGTITGGANAGPLIEVRNAVGGFENRILNADTGSIIADTTNLGMANRGVAIRGSNGSEAVTNFGEIEGIVDLGRGNDLYSHTSSATLTGTLFGGAGRDRVLLAAIDTNPDPVIFDLSQLDGVETVSIFGSAHAWQLSNATSFRGLTEVLAGGRLIALAGTTLGGDLSLFESSELAITLDGAATPLTVEGTARLGGTLIIDSTDPILNDSEYRLIDLAQAPQGNFEAIEIVNSMLGRSAEDLRFESGSLMLITSSSLEILARGPTQRAIAAHLTAIDGTPGTSGELQSLIDELYSADRPSSEVASVFTGLSPEAYDVQTTILVESGRQVANLLFDRPRECTEGDTDRWSGGEKPLSCHARTWSPWLASIGSFRARDKFDGHPRYDARLGGLVFGIDSRPIGGLAFTFAVSSQRGSIDVATAGESTTTLTDVTGHVSFTHAGFRSQAVVSWGHGFHEDRRRIRFARPDNPSAFFDTGSDTDHDSDRITLAGELGYLFEIGPIQIEPLIGVDWAWVDQRTIDEKNPVGGTGVLIPGRDDQVGSIRGGLRLSTRYEHSRYLSQQLEWMDGTWQPMLDVRWRQYLEGEKRDFGARFRGSPDSLPGFQVQGEEDAGGLEIGAGLSFVPRSANRLEFGMRYQAYVAENTLEQDLTARVTLGF